MKSDIKEIIKIRYGGVARKGNSCCGQGAFDISRKIGYSEGEINSIPDGSFLGLGCGNPVAIASLKEGETVLDLGSGAGVDCFLASERVGKNGKVIGVDMTSEMIEKARENARKGNFSNVEFRLGEIEKLPVDDLSVDAVISNCVINLVPDKSKAFREIFRVLKPGGRFMVSDIVLLKELPDAVKNSSEAYVSCLAGAMLKNDYIDAVKNAGFKDITILSETPYPLDCIITNDPLAASLIEGIELPPEEIKSSAESVQSMSLTGTKPLE